MSNVPVFIAAAAGGPSYGGEVNQFLGTHNSTLIYGASQTAASTTGSALYLDSDAQWMSQGFTTGSSQTAVSYLLLQLSTVGGSPTLSNIPVITVSLYSDTSGFPGTSLGSVAVNSEYVYSQPFWAQIPLIITGLAPSTTYHIVTNMVGTSGHYYAWQRTTATSGAATSTDGINWTARPYGLMYQVYGPSSSASVGAVQLIYEDSGIRFTQLTYNALGQLTQITESTTSQMGSPLVSQRTLSYTNGVLTGVS